MSEDVKQTKVVSVKHGIQGTVFEACGMAVVLRFECEGRKVEIGMSVDESLYDLEDVASRLMDAYNDSYKAQPTRMHYWFLRRYEGWIQLIGRVAGHSRIEDSHRAFSSEVQGIEVNLNENEIIVATLNTVYHCPLEYCSFEDQDEHSDLIPGYGELKTKYAGKIPDPTIEPGKLLLVLSNFDKYYFHSVYYIPKGEGRRLLVRSSAHIGMFQDSNLVMSDDGRVDLRYFPHFRNIEFYSEHTDNTPWYIENIGYVTLYANTSVGMFKIAPGERKEVCAANVDNAPPELAKGDLYPAGFII